MKILSFLGICLLIGIVAAVDSNESSGDASNSTDVDEANFVDPQSSAEALKVEPLPENLDTRFEEEPELSIPAEEGEAFQGDMVLTPEQRERMLDTSIVESRVGYLNTVYRWPKLKGRVIVPYTFDRRITSNKQKTAVLQAMRRIGDVTCVRFKARTNEPDYVVITPHKQNCQSAVGRRGKAQLVELGPNCFGVGTVMHELIHALGYTHMQNHPQRDQFVVVHQNRIPADKWSNFVRVNAREYGNFNTPYDFKSIMHYGLSFFLKPNLPKGTPTMEPKKGYERFRGVIGQRDTLSSGDIKRINTMYKCSA